MNTTERIPVHHSHLGCINTLSGAKIDFRSPRSSEFNIEDIATALSNICRFGGHVKRFYSVAQHSVFVMHLAPVVSKREALLHDMTEAYLSDVISPLKKMLPEYQKLEGEFMEAMLKKFNLGHRSHIIHEMVKPYDIIALELEHEALQKNNPTPLMVSMNMHDMLNDGQHAFWTPEVAKREFLKSYNILFNE